MKIIFKHSYKCPVSLRAKQEMDGFLKDSTAQIEYEMIDVIGSRQRSNEVVEKYGIGHESPQVIIVDDNDKVLWTASHRKIREKKIKSAVEG
ncbi:MAG: bacillithiol system redox-active protein YtxJ [Candidatus Aminicenantes bacterium]|nr:bacillithiol system redox-active protein YtxJ [Candidatus Aminicenantes bacterium]